MSQDNPKRPSSLAEFLEQSKASVQVKYVPHLSEQKQASEDPKASPEPLATANQQNFSKSQAVQIDNGPAVQPLRTQYVDMSPVDPARPVGANDVNQPLRVKPEPDEEQ
ncbi:MAG: hypothetical protein ACYCQJ_05220 [Nitrososphaerales archaeon]